MFCVEINFSNTDFIEGTQKSGQTRFSKYFLHDVQIFHMMSISLVGLWQLLATDLDDSSAKEFGKYLLLYVCSVF